MQSWQEHNTTTWVICDLKHCVTAHVIHDPQTGFYTAHKNNVTLGLYTNLDAAMCACEPHASISQATQHKITKLKVQHEHFSEKTIENMPWDS